MVGRAVRPGDGDVGPDRRSCAWPAPAKLNLFLHVLGRREDGYHRLQTVFQILDLADSLDFSLRLDPLITRSHGPAGLPVDEDLCVRAARLLQREAGVSAGVEITLHKRLPMGAGLGGGSSNAATTLVALNHLWQVNWPEDRLAALGLSLGADVPVFIRGHSAWAEGVGEQLEPVTLPSSWFLVLIPGCEVSTRAVFADPQLTRNSTPIKMADFAAGRSRNDCEPVVRKRFPEVGCALDWLTAHAEGVTVRMTGSGSAVFATLPSRQAALSLQPLVPVSWQSLVARGCERSGLHARLADERSDREYSWGVAKR